jgi:hypothetical protein
MPRNKNYNIQIYEKMAGSTCETVIMTSLFIIFSPNLNVVTMRLLKEYPITLAQKLISLNQTELFESFYSTRKLKVFFLATVYTLGVSTLF